MIVLLGLQGEQVREGRFHKKNAGKCGYSPNRGGPILLFWANVRADIIKVGCNAAVWPRNTLKLIFRHQAGANTRKESTASAMMSAGWIFDMDSKPNLWLSHGQLGMVAKKKRESLIFTKRGGLRG